MRFRFVAVFSLSLLVLGCDHYELCEQEFDACEAWCVENAGRGVEACILDCDVAYAQCVKEADEQELYDRD